jgi:hypothetical protein
MSSSTPSTPKGLGYETNPEVPTPAIRIVVPQPYFLELMACLWRVLEQPLHRPLKRRTTTVMVGDHCDVRE